MSDERDPKDEPGSQTPVSAEAIREQVKRARDARKIDASEPDSDPNPDDIAEPFDLDETDLRDALRGALRPPPGSIAPKLLPSVQRKLRIRSRGKFFGDGWSTAQKPRSTYLVTSIIMLIVVLVVFFALIPWSVANLR